LNSNLRQPELLTSRQPTKLQIKRTHGELYAFCFLLLQDLGVLIKGVAENDPKKEAVRVGRKNKRKEPRVPIQQSAD
jgi:hypothetical protein